MKNKKQNIITAVLFFVLFALAIASAADKKNAPALSTRDINGKQVELKTLLANGPVIVWFWNSCCGNKKSQTKALKAIYTKYKAQGLEILGISEDGTKKMASTKQFVAVNKLSFLIVMDNSGNILNQFQGFAVPSVYLISKDGLIQYYKSGYLPGDEKGLETELNKLFPVKE